MKRAKFLNLLMVSVLLASVAAGCKKNPKNITTIPGSNSVRTAPPTDTSGALRGNVPEFGNRLGTTAGGTGTTAIPFNTDNTQIPVGPENAEEDRESLSASTVYFEFDRSAIKTSEQPKLEQVATYLKSNPGKTLKIEGHCDERGTEEYNRSLGERRAIAAREFLIQKHGIESGRITTVSFGEDKPVDLGKTEEAYAKNRRDEFVILQAR